MRISIAFATVIHNYIIISMFLVSKLVIYIPPKSQKKSSENEGACLLRQHSMQFAIVVFIRCILSTCIFMSFYAYLYNFSCSFSLYMNTCV